MTQDELPLGLKPAKKPAKPSAGRRSIDLLAVEAIRSGAASGVEDLLRQVARVPRRAMFNALLAILQMPHATVMLSAEDWDQRWGRRIVPGQRPLVLMFPFGPIEFVFDVTQTEPGEHARPLPVDPTPFAMASVSEAGRVLAQLIAEVEKLGVRVVDARTGAALAGKICRAENGGWLTIPHGRSTTAVPVRWVVELNSAHTPTEKLATLAHELGHLFCGHVGADKGDFWPNRLVEEHVQREFEAESVALLVFLRIAPEALLPPYLEDILEPGQPPPDEGWSYVVQAADQVLDLVL